MKNLSFSSHCALGQDSEVGEIKRGGFMKSINWMKTVVALGALFSVAALGDVREARRIAIGETLALCEARYLGAESDEATRSRDGYESCILGMSVAADSVLEKEVDFNRWATETARDRTELRATFREVRAQVRAQCLNYQETNGGIRHACHRGARIFRAIFADQL